MSRSAKNHLTLFFPPDPLPSSPYGLSQQTWENDIHSELVSILQKRPELVTGYSLTEGHGGWFDPDTKSWDSDNVQQISLLVSPGFVQSLSSPTCPTEQRRFIGRIAKLSCVDMGHAEFWCVIDSKLVEVWTPTGIFLVDRVWSYAELLSSS